jgi:hypothetical protein
MAADLANCPSRNPEAVMHSYDRGMDARTIRCAECLHDHPCEDVENVLLGISTSVEMMCHWCIRGDYASDPLNSDRDLERKVQLQAEASEEPDANFCPSCGVGLGFQPWDGSSASQEICPRCGIQFGYTDVMGGDPRKRELLYVEWGRAWQEAGCKRHWQPSRQEVIAILQRAKG